MLQHLAQQCLYVARELTSTREGAVHTKSPLTRKSFGRFHLISRPALNLCSRPRASWAFMAIYAHDLRLGRSLSSFRLSPVPGSSCRERD